MLYCKAQKGGEIMIIFYMKNGDHFVLGEGKEIYSEYCDYTRAMIVKDFYAFKDGDFDDQDKLPAFGIELDTGRIMALQFEDVSHISHDKSLVMEVEND